MRRLLVPTLAVAGFLVLGAFVLWLSAGAFSRAQDRARDYRYLSEALEPVERPSDAVRWTPAIRPLVRAFLPEAEAMVGKALTQGWRAFAAASDTGETALLADHFAGIALSRAQLAAREAWTGGTRMVVLEQTAGAGSRFHLEVPLTLSVVRGLVVEVGDEAYAFPLAHIERMCDLEPADIVQVEGRPH